MYCPHFLLTAKKNTIFVLFRWDSSVSTAACTAGTATVGVFSRFFSIFELGGVTKHLMAAPSGVSSRQVRIQDFEMGGEFL